VTQTRPRDLFAVALVTAVVVGIVVRLTYGSLPQLPLFAGASLGVLGIAEVVGGNMLRARIRRDPGTRPVQPLVAARAVLLAKASSLAGAIMTGAWGGLLAHVVPLAADVTAAGSDALAGTVGIVCSLGLVGGALWLEHCCRTPDDPGDEPNGHSPTS
jgi:Protein of unknown function (DUF3180)